MPEGKPHWIKYTETYWVKVSDAKTFCHNAGLTLPNNAPDIIEFLAVDDERMDLFDKYGSEELVFTVYDDDNNELATGS